MLVTNYQSGMSTDLGVNICDDKQDHSETME